MYPIFSILGFDPATLAADLQDVIAKLQAIIDDSNAIKVATEAILADMVGEVTFLAAMTEINLAIASLAEDIDLAIAALGAGIAAAIAGQTAALIANGNANTNLVLSVLNNIQSGIASIQALTIGISSNVSTISTNSTNTVTILNNILSTLSGFDLDLTSMLSSLNSLVTISTNILTHVVSIDGNIGLYLPEINVTIGQVNAELASIYSLLDLRLLQFQVNLDAINSNTAATNSSVQDVGNRVQNIYNFITTTQNTQTNAIISLLTDIRDTLTYMKQAYYPPGYVIGTDPPTYALIYQLWQSLNYGGYFTSSTSPPALRVRAT